MTRVVFCCDAGPVRGIGHVMRCLALAEELQEHGVVCTFVADLAAVPWAAAEVAARGCAISEHGDGEPGLLDAVLALAPDGVVLDSYGAPPEVSAGLRTAGVPVVAIIDGDPRGQQGDLYLDQNLGAEGTPGPAGVPRLAGLRYALLRSEVLGLRPAAPPAGTRHDPPAVLAYFGGTDAYGGGPVLAAALAASGEPFEATVVAPHAALRTSVEAVKLQPGQRMTAIEPTGSLMALAAGSDVVVSASGTSLWELLCLGAAAAIVRVVDNQDLGYARVTAAGLAVGLGHLDGVREDPSAAAATLATLLRDVAWRDRLRAAGWALVDGQGRRRVAAALLDLIGRQTPDADG